MDYTSRIYTEVDTVNSSVWVISYDLPDDRRRNKVFKVLKDYGTRVQYSVFECLLDITRFQELWTRLEAIVIPEEDSIRFYSLCGSCRKKVIIIGSPIFCENNEVIVI